MKAKTLLITGSVILILEGGFVATGGIATKSMTLICYGAILFFTGIIGINGVIFATQKKAGYFFIIMGIAIWLPVLLTVMFIGGGGGHTGAAASGLGLPALIVTVLWCAGGIKNIAIPDNAKKKITGRRRIQRSGLTAKGIPLMQNKQAEIGRAHV
jgi:hypothetical protein